jgi:hypothetical protein
MRSDECMREDVSECLTDHSLADASETEGGINGCGVTLSGGIVHCGRSHWIGLASVRLSPP